MEVSQLIELMNAVSEAGLTDFCYEENGVSVKIKKHPEKKIVASAPVEMIAPAAVAAPLQVCADTSVSADTDVSEEVTGNIVKSDDVELIAVIEERAHKKFENEVSQNGRLKGCTDHVIKEKDYEKSNIEREEQTEEKTR